MRCGAVIPAAGQSRRFGGSDKTLLPLAGRPLLEWTIRPLIEADVLSEIVIVVSEANQFPVLDLITNLHASIPVSAVPGGDLRMESVQAGVRALDDGCDLVLIHDAARPLVTVDLVQSSVRAAREHGAVIPGIPVADTIKRVTDDRVAETLDRTVLRAVQTPQVFRKDWLVAAYHAFDARTEATDEASIIEAAGYPVHVIPGEPSNLKLTTSSDAIVAEALLRDRETR